MGAREVQIGSERDSAGAGRFFEGDEEEFHFPMRDKHGDPLNLAEAQEIDFRVYEDEWDSKDPTNAVISKTMGNGITTIDPNNEGTEGTAAVSMDYEDTNEIADGSSETFYFELWVKDAASRQLTMFYGKFTIHPSGK